MLYSALIGIAIYYATLFGVGVLVNSRAIEGTLIAFAAICFVGAYLARNSRFVRRLANTLGGIATVLVLAELLLLPVLQGSGNVWVTIIAVFSGFACYIVTRRYWHRRFLRRDRQSGRRPAPPFGKEWTRWVIAFVA